MEEKEILRILGIDREAGCTAVIEQYQHMLWGICARRLDDPEDIRECVLAALGDFCLRWERFDPESGSLKSYLAAIADRKALDKFRQNCRWERACQAAAQLFKERSIRVRSTDFVRALEMLVERSGGAIAGQCAILAEGDAIDRKDIFYLEPLPLFFD